MEVKDGYVRQKHGGAIKPIKKGEVRNPYGRPKKIALTLKTIGYHASEIVDTLKILLSLDKNELLKFSKKEHITALEAGAVKMIENFLKKGNTEILEYIVSKKISTESNIKVTQKTDFTLEELKKELAERGISKNVFEE